MYLGSLLTEDGRFEKEIKRNIGPNDSTDHIHQDETIKIL